MDQPREMMVRVVGGPMDGMEKLASTHHSRLTIARPLQLPPGPVDQEHWDAFNDATKRLLEYRMEHLGDGIGWAWPVAWNREQAVKHLLTTRTHKDTAERWEGVVKTLCKRMDSAGRVSFCLSLAEWLVGRVRDWTWRMKERGLEEANETHPDK